MSPLTTIPVCPLSGFLRVSGDEPLSHFFGPRFPGFSPRERG